MKHTFILFFLFISASAFGQEIPKPSEIPDTCKTPAVENNCIYNDTWVETEAEFPGGEKAYLKYMKKHTKFPKEAVKNKVGGKVLVQFIVEKDGSISNVKLNESVKTNDKEKQKFADMINNEAIRVICSMPKWKPATYNGKPVRMRFVAKLNFNI